MARTERGVSIAEAIIACFILVFAMVVSTAVFHTALQYSVSIDQRFIASRVAERKLEEIKSWSRNTHGTNGEQAFEDGWERYEGEDVEDPDNPGFKVKTEVVDHHLYSPSTAFEEVFFSSQEDINIDPGLEPEAMERKRALENSARLVKATAYWGDGPKERVTLSCVIADPIKDYGWDAEDVENAIQLSNASGGSFPTVMAKDEVLTLKVELTDAGGNSVKNPAIQWYIEPTSSGSGTLFTRPAQTDKVRFKNIVRVDVDPTKSYDDPNKFVDVYGGGTVKIVARARLGGVDVVRASPEIELIGDTD